MKQGSNCKCTQQQRRGVQSIQRAVSLLRIVSQGGRRGLTLSHIARTADLKVSTAHRMLSALTQEGLLSLNPETRRYRPGFELFMLGRGANQFLIRDTCRPALERIAQRTGDTAYLVVREGFDSLCIDRVEGSAPLRLLLDVGARRPLGMGAGSLCLFAFMADEAVNSLLQYNADRIRAYSGMETAAMQQLIKQCRRKGYALTEGVVDRGVTGIGVPLYDRKGRIRGAVSVAAIAGKIEKSRYDAVAAMMKQEVDKIQPAID